MSCSALTVLCLFALIVLLSAEINEEDARKEPEPDPFRLHRLRAGDKETE